MRGEAEIFLASLLRAANDPFRNSEGKCALEHGAVQTPNRTH